MQGAHHLNPPATLGSTRQLHSGLKICDKNESCVMNPAKASVEYHYEWQIRVVN
ncbi:hypothetical protein KIN20_024641 [Parelaphostrongylus tenuis]|uniref:Uncharacterized protein n=1 Tax=Parelaphostrongylus tenuis TaxID=148309 RepID=A0AAD5MTS6_PARTN|nr:hypothetical protein KIN20_024641 [Parelaphostrongylus tenuis]